MNDGLFETFRLLYILRHELFQNQAGRDVLFFTEGSKLLKLLPVEVNIILFPLGFASEFRDLKGLFTVNHLKMVIEQWGLVI